MNLMLPPAVQEEHLHLNPPWCEVKRRDEPCDPHWSEAASLGGAVVTQEGGGDRGGLCSQMKVERPSLWQKGDSLSLWERLNDFMTRRSSSVLGGQRPLSHPQQQSPTGLSPDDVSPAESRARKSRSSESRKDCQEIKPQNERNVSGSRFSLNWKLFRIILLNSISSPLGGGPFLCLHHHLYSLLPVCGVFVLVLVRSDLLRLLQFWFLPGTLKLWLMSADVCVMDSDLCSLCPADSRRVRCRWVVFFWDLMIVGGTGKTFCRSFLT